MAVEVLEGAAVHEGQVLRRVDVDLAAVGAGGGQHRVDGCAVVDADGQRYLAGPGVADRLVGEGRPLRVRQQHRVDGVGPDHAGGGLVAELRVVDRADGRVEGLGLGQVADGKVHEDLLG